MKSRLFLIKNMRRDVGIPPYFYNAVNAGRRPLRFVRIWTELAAGEYHFCHRQKYHIASANYHTHLRISLVLVGADIIRPNAYAFINPQSRYARQRFGSLERELASEARLRELTKEPRDKQYYENRSEATLNYALRIANYTLYNRVRAEPFLNYSLFIFH